MSQEAPPVRKNARGSITVQLCTFWNHIFSQSIFCPVIMTEHMSKRSSRVFRYMHDYTPFRQSPMALFATLQCST